MVSGDNHMIAFDNGYNNPFGNFMSVVAAPLDKENSCKGGKWTFGPYMHNN